MNRVLVALDVADRARAMALADRLRGGVGGFKIGKELFTSASIGSHSAGWVLMLDVG